MWRTWVRKDLIWYVRCLPSPYDEIRIRLYPLHRLEGTVNQQVGWVAQEVAIFAVAGLDFVARQACLCLRVGGVIVHIRDMPKVT